MKEQEIWKDVVGYEGIYSVSNQGRVWSHLKGGKYMVGEIDKDGYRKLLFNYQGVRKKFFVHRLVAIAFLPNIEDYPVVNHLDSCRSNNTPSNLEWCTVGHNTRHQYSAKLTLGDKRPLSALNKYECHLMAFLRVQVGMVYREIKDHLNLSCRADQIGRVLTGERMQEVSGFTKDYSKKGVGIDAVL